MPKILSKDGMKEVEGTKFEILVAKRTYINEEGKKVTQCEWKTANHPISIGSFAKPNPEILSVKWDVPPKKEDTFAGRIDKMFKGE